MISVIVPVYNSVKSLRQCVHSIQQQTYTDFELILVDDGSSDGSAELCDKLAAENAGIQVIHKPNGGVSSARNAGIDAAKGEYITFCDSDDYLEPDYLENLVQTARSNPDCGHIWCCFQTVTGYQKENAVPNYVSAEPILYYGLNDYMTLHEMWLDAGPCNKLYQSRIIKEAGLRFLEDLSLGEDWLFNLAYIDASANDRIAVVTKPLYNYVRGNNDSLDSKYRRDLLDIYRRLNADCLSHLKKWNASPEQMEQEKIEQNSAFMQTKEFKNVMDARTCYVHPLYLAAYKSGNFANVLRIDWLYKIKTRITGKRI